MALETRVIEEPKHLALGVFRKGSATQVFSQKEIYLLVEVPACILPCSQIQWEFNYSLQRGTILVVGIKRAL